jgi:hypothetical protein
MAERIFSLINGGADDHRPSKGDQLREITRLPSRLPQAHTHVQRCQQPR